MSRKISMRIDGGYVDAHEGQTVLEVARANDKYIPTLCYLEGLSPVGACRLCIVEVAGVNKLLPACTTPAQDGMAVTTQSERLNHYRKMAVEFLLSERNHYCAICVSNGHCELQAMAMELGVTHVSYMHRYPSLPADMSHSRFVIDHNRCILCTRCVRVCAELEGAHVWDINGRGIQARVAADLDRPWGESSSCTNCGKCVQACPTGALAEKGKSVEEMTKTDGRIAKLASRRGVHA